MKIIQQERHLETRGLSKLGRNELRLEFGPTSSLAGLRDVLEFLFNYLSVPETDFKNGQTIQYGYWILMLKEEADFYSVYEFEPESIVQWVPGADRAASYWETQQKCCDEHNSKFRPPIMTAMAAISDGVDQGLPVEGIRYNAPFPMSGWYFTTKDFDGNIASLRIIHLYHLALKRPELIKYLALEPGYHFDQSQSDIASYSLEVANGND